MDSHGFDSPKLDESFCSFLVADFNEAMKANQKMMMNSDPQYSDIYRNIYCNEDYKNNIKNLNFKNKRKCLKFIIDNGLNKDIKSPFFRSDPEFKDLMSRYNAAKSIKEDLLNKINKLEIENNNLKRRIELLDISRH